MEQSKAQLMHTEIETALAITKDAYASKADVALSRYGRGDKGVSAWEYPLAFPLIEMGKASLVAQEPQYILVPLNENPETLAIVPVWEKLLNHFAHTLDLRTRAEEAADWELITGFAVAKVGYTEEDVAVVGESSSEVLGKIFVATLDPRCFFVDPYCQKTDLSDARYCGDVSYPSKADLEQSAAYDPEEVEKLKPKKVGSKYPQAQEIRVGNSSDLPDEYGIVEIREMVIRNRYTKQLELTAYSEQGTVLRELSPLPETFRHFNYVPLVFFPIPGNFYGFSILSKVDAICDMIDSALKRVADRWEHNPEKFAAAFGQMDKTAQDAATSGELFNFINTQDVPANQAFAEVRGTIIKSDEMSYIQLLVRLFQWISGMSQMELGTGSSKTATEAGLIGRAGDMRSARRMNVMERWVSTIGKRILTICRADLNSTPEDSETNIPFSEILSGDDLQVWREYEELQSDREKEKQDTDITVRMSLPVSVAAIHRRDKSLEFLRSVGQDGVLQLLQAQGKMVDIAALIQSIARDTGLSEDVIRDLPEGEKIVEEKEGGQ